HRLFDLIDRPAGDLDSLILAALRHVLGQRFHARRRTRSLDVFAVVVGREDALVDVGIAVDPDRVVIIIVVGPQRVIEEIAVGEGPEQRADPAQMIVPMPAVVPERMEGAAGGKLAVRRKRPSTGERRIGMGEMRSRQARANGCRIADVIERTTIERAMIERAMIERAMIERTMCALAVDCGMECRSARMTDLRGRMRIEAPGVEPATGHMGRTVRRKTRAAHVYAAHVRAAATHAHPAAAEVCAAATPEMGTAAATA